jgi:hypothetical protein
MARPGIRRHTLAQRAFELRQLKLPGARIDTRPGRELRMSFEIAPTEFSPLYHCLLIVPQVKVSPSMYVTKPDLMSLSKGVRPPHIYSHEAGRTELCLWWPKMREWTSNMKLTDTYIAWTAEWLWYFEDWLITGEWAGGGAHPD